MSNVRASARTLVLTNSDLLHCIFTFVPAPLPDSLSMRDNPSHLARCTTVCRAFHEPAIRLLWRKLHSLFPLWQLLAPPNAKYPRSRFHGDKLSDYLHQVISARLYDDPIVWDRFLWHTARVRDIACSTHDVDSQETNAAQLLLIQTVLLQNGGKTVLPLLHSIEWMERAPADGSLIPFFTSTLRHATFSFAGPADEMPHVLLLRRLRECSPYLQKIIISTTLWDKDNVDVGPRLVQELLSFDRLCEVHIHSAKGPTAFRDLVAKPNLASLTVYVYPVTGSWVGPSSSILVRDLRELSVAGTRPALAALFDRVRFLALESATLDVQTSLDPVDETIAVLTAFANTVPTNHLRSLDLYISGSQSWGIDVALRELVGPVLHLRELRCFRFGTEELAPRFEDADIEALVGAWPKLEHLSLECVSPSHTDALSIHALHHIHAHCRNLEELAMRDIRCPAIGVHPIPAPLDHPSPHPLRHLSVDRRPVPAFGYSRVSDETAEALTRYLLELFPAANRERSKGMPDQSTSSAYRKIFADR